MAILSNTQITGTLGLTGIITSKVSPSGFVGTASYAINALYGGTGSLSSSYAITASYASNGGGGGGITSSFYEFPVQSARLPAISSSRIDAGNINWALLFNKTQNAYWQWRVPVNYNGNLRNTFQFYTTGSQSGIQTVTWNVYLYTITPGDFTNVSASTPTLTIPITTSLSSSQAAGYLVEQSVWLTGSAHAISGSDFMIYRLERDSGSADTATGSVALVSNMVDFKVI